jgi:hypothetical protein
MTPMRVIENKSKQLQNTHRDEVKDRLEITPSMGVKEFMIRNELSEVIEKGVSTTNQS